MNPVQNLSLKIKPLKKLVCYMFKVKRYRILNIGLFICGVLIITDKHINVDVPCQPGVDWH
jgi:hypothetical protein